MHNPTRPPMHENLSEGLFALRRVLGRVHVEVLSQHWPMGVAVRAECRRLQEHGRRASAGLPV
eukprot:6783414-Prymnesium_polylepis.1